MLQAAEVGRESAAVAVLERPVDLGKQQQHESAAESQEDPRDFSKGAGTQEQESGTAPPEIQSQLAGLRRRAAMRRNPRV